MPSRIINAGWLNPYDLARFKEPELIMKDLAIDIGNSSITINHSFFCYGNGHNNESIGSPFTRLVIEGKIGRDTYYYPIRINPQNGGIKRASRYIYDVTIRRAGATHPDGSLDDTDIDINVGIEVWQEKEWQNIRY